MSAPALPLPPVGYSQAYQLEFARVLRLYFTGQVDQINTRLTVRTATAGQVLVANGDGTYGWGDVDIPDSDPAAKMYAFYNFGGF